MKFHRTARVTAGAILAIGASVGTAMAAQPAGPAVQPSVEAKSASAAEALGGFGYPRGYKSDLTPVAEPSVIGTPAQIGQWSVANLQLPGLAIHASPLPGADVRFLLIRGSGNNADNFAAGSFQTYVWNVTQGTIHTIPTPDDMFCSGHAFAADGRVIVAGGTKDYPATVGGVYHGSRQVYGFDPVAETWQELAPTTAGHWYGLMIEDGYGRLNLISGLDENGEYVTQTEIYYPATNTWQRLATKRSFPFYSGFVLTRKGQFFYTGTNVFGVHVVPTGFWTPYNNAYQTVPGLPFTTSRNQAASAMLFPAQNQVVMTAGGGGPGVNATTNSVALINLAAAKPQWVAGPPLLHAKMHISLVNIPNGELLQTNGGAGSNTRPVLDAQIYNPPTGKWRTVASPTVARLYHSEAVLGADGRVYTFGSNPANVAPELRIEVYSPPYMFQPNRPTISVARPTLRYGGVYGISGTTSSSWARFEMIHPSAATHSADPDQKPIAVPFRILSPGRLQLTLTSEVNLAPPGWYMLHGVDTRGVPSPAVWIQIT